MIKEFLIYLFIINAVTFIVYGLDKKKAKRRQWRISENTLLGLAGCGGSIGALIAMRYFHHKTQKVKFSCGVPFILMAQIVLAAVIYKELIQR